jgi:hypothetical protein
MGKPALDLSQLTADEKLELIDDLWRSLSADDHRSVTQPWPATGSHATPSAKSRHPNHKHSDRSRSTSTCRPGLDRQSPLS